MKRTLAILLCVCLLLGGLPLVAFAHPGRTDSNGGHWNHSTGEYHIHGTPDNPGDSNPTGNTTNQHWEDPNEGNDLVLWIILVSFVVLLVYSLVQFFRKDKSRSTSKESKAAPLTDEKLTTPKKDDTSSQNRESPPPIDSPVAPSLKTTRRPPISPMPPTRKSENNPLPTQKIVPPPVPKSQTVVSSSQTPTPPPTPVRSTFPFAGGIIADYPDILGADPAYVTEAQVLAYALSIETPRGKRAVTEQLILENISIDESSKPFRVACSTTSLNSYQQYRTTLVSCSCKDHQTRHLPCKHMIALAIRVNAITVNTEALQKRQERS